MSPIRLLSAILVLATLSMSACSRSSSRRVVEPDTGTVAGDFQTFEDYLDNPVVATLLEEMATFPGNTPPDVTGEYFTAGFVVAATDQRLLDNLVEAEFCFGAPFLGELDVEVFDPSIVDEGARSFIEGTNDNFTVYTAFKSEQTVSDGETCEIHEVNVISGRMRADGTIADLTIGVGIVGLVGRCDNLFVGDVQISESDSQRTGEGCDDPAPPVDPVDPDAVLVTIENNLVVDTLIFIGDAADPIAEVEARSVTSFEVLPPFNIEFETLRPVAGQDNEGNDLFMGEIICAAFPIDDTSPGGAVTYSLINQLDTEVFFAPLPTNNTDLDIFSLVNSGVVIEDCLGVPTDGWDCFCAIPPSLDPVVIGYYSYSVPGVIAANQANVEFRNVADEGELVDRFQGPFILDEASGTIPLLVERR